LQSCNSGHEDDYHISFIFLRFTQFPHGPLLALFTVGKTQRTLENGGMEMKIRNAGRVQRIGFAVFAFALAFLACGAAMASDVERRIPVIRDTAGSGLTMEISREGTRQTATPFLTLFNPTIQEIEDRIVRIVKITTRSAAKEIPPGETGAGSLTRNGLTGTPRKDAGQPETTLASLPPVPGEITIRSVRGFLKGLRSSRKEKPAQAVVVAVPEQRLGMADISQREAN
jgi:hypothetical protein